MTALCFGTMFFRHASSEGVVQRESCFSPPVGWSSFTGLDHWLEGSCRYNSQFPLFEALFSQKYVRRFKFIIFSCNWHIYIRCGVRKSAVDLFWKARVGLSVWESPRGSKLWQSVAGPQ